MSSTNSKTATIEYYSDENPDSLETQRSAVRTALTERVLELACQGCPGHGSGCTGVCYGFINNVGKELTFRAVWPPQYSKWDLGSLLERLKLIKTAEYGYTTRDGLLRSGAISGPQVRSLAYELDHMANGLCLDCMLVENKGECTHS